MQDLRSTLFLKTALASAVLLSCHSHAADITSAQEVITDTNERYTITGDIVTGSERDGKPIISVKARLNGITINSGVVIDTSPGPFATDPTNPGAAGILIGSGGQLTDGLINKGYILDGVFIIGESRHQTNNALLVEGENSTNSAGIQGSYTIVDGGISHAESDHTVNIQDYGYIDFIAAGNNSTLSTNGAGKSAVYVGTNGQLGGTTTFQTASATGSDTLLDDRTDAKEALRIDGLFSSSKGAAVVIDGTATGKVTVSGAGIVRGQGGGLGGGATEINGTLNGTIENLSGDYEGGIFITGNHTGSLTVIENAPAGHGAVYWAKGTTADSANLNGRYTAINGGISRSENNHAVYLDSYSKTDFIASANNSSRIETSAPGKSAIYVTDSAQLGGFAGRTAADPAILIENSASIYSASGPAITVDGDFIGTIHVNNGSLAAGSSSLRAIDFSEANNPLSFIQEGENSLTTGAILASAGYKNDMVVFRGGDYIGESILNVDHLVVSSAAGEINVTGDFTLPTLTTIEVVEQTSGQNTQTTIDTENPMITVGAKLHASPSGSRVVVAPADKSVYQALINETTLVLSTFGSIDGNADDFITTESSALLLSVTPDYSNSTQLTLKVRARTKAELEEKLVRDGFDERKAAVLGAALTAAVSGSGDNADKLFTALNDPDLNIKKIAADAQPDISGGTQKTGQMMINANQNVILKRTRGIRRGINFGDQFKDGAVWGQMLYSSGNQDKMDGEPGFSSNIWGFVLGADTELESGVRVGVAGTYARSSVNVDDNSSLSANNFLGTAYLSWKGRRGYYMDTMMTSGGGWNDTEKTVAGQKVTGRFNSTQFGLRMIVGKEWRTGNWSLSPQTEFNYGIVQFKDYDEEGNTGWEQKVEQDNYKTIEIGGGLKIDGEFWSRSYTFRPELSLMSYYDFESRGALVKSVYLAGGDKYQVTGPDRDQLRLQAGLGFGLEISNWSIRTGYDMNWSKNYSSHSFSARVRYEF